MEDIVFAANHANIYEPHARERGDVVWSICRLITSHDEMLL